MAVLIRADRTIALQSFVDVLDLVKTLGFTKVHLQTENRRMRTQLLGIHISLMVHGMAVILLYGASQGMTPTVRTVALDFSLDSGGRMGENGSAAGGRSGGDEAQPKDEASPPEDSPGDRKIAPPDESGTDPLVRCCRTTAVGFRGTTTGFRRDDPRG